MATALPARTVFARWHGAGIVFKRHTYEWVLPAALGPHLKYDKAKVPAPYTRVVHCDVHHVEIWELTRSDHAMYYRRVFALGKDNESYLLHLAARRILRGYSGGTTLESVSFV